MIEEKRFKIQKIEKYNEKISKEKKNAIWYAIFATVSATSAIYCILSGANNLEFAIFAFAAGAGAFMGNMRNLIGSICKKTIYETKVEEIQEQLELMGTEIQSEMQSDRPRSNGGRR